MVKISVIIPVYNVEKYLKECLDSVINQSFEDMEIICVNDGSSDSSPEILDEYQKTDSRIKIITQENRGAAAARNIGLDNATGKYIYFMDGDDYLDLDALERLYEISNERNLDLLIFKMANFDERTGKEDYSYSDMPFLLNIGKDVFNYEDFNDNLLNFDVSVCTKFFKRELIEDKRFPEGLIFEDNSFNIDYLLDAERISFLDECLYHRRIRDSSVMTRASKQSSDLIEIYDIIYAKFRDKGLYPEFKEKLFMRKTDAIYYRYTLLLEEYKNDYFDLMKESFLQHKEEYENDFDLDTIETYHKNLFNAVIESDTGEEFEANLKSRQRKSKAIQKDERRIEQNESKNLKIADYLRKLKRKL